MLDLQACSSALVEGQSQDGDFESGTSSVDGKDSLLTMGSRHLAVIMAPHLERADALAQSFHGKALFISIDQDGLYRGLQIFLTNDDWVLRDLVFNVRGFVTQPRLLVWVGER